ncbi:hypothetical protein F4810DRAFT_257090 [Camillea tinctor]|nr:hypothetical protein F4810DRAFT_257090 [Camillea tinctor]
MRTNVFITALAAASVSTALETNAFRLVVGVVDHDLNPSLNGAMLGWETTGDCLAELVVKADDYTPATFYQSEGTVSAYDAEGPSSAGIIVTPGGTATVPSSKPVELKCGDGTPGVTIRQTPYAVTYELDFEDGVWMACPSPDNAERIAITYRNQGQRTIEGCAEVKLFVMCDPNSGKLEGSETVGCNKL